MNSKLVQQILKFVVVGVINTAVDLAVLNILIHVTGRGQNGGFYTFYKTISFTVAVIGSYFMNKYWAFAGGRASRASIQFSEFIIISIGGLILNVLSASYVANHIPPVYGLNNLWPSIAALVGTAVGLIWNFFGYKFIVFKEPQNGDIPVPPPTLPPA